MDRREELLEGICMFPRQILSLIHATRVEEEIISDFWDNLWHNFLNEKSLDTVSWLEVVGSKKFNSLLFHLSKSGWITSRIESNYAFIELNKSKLLKWVNDEELMSMKFRHKFLHYRLKKTRSVLDNTVQINGKHIPTGLKRSGFMKAGNHTFKYDTKYLKKYLQGIAFNLKKGLEASNKDITYQEIIDELVSYYANENGKYSLGNCLLDSRGRAIFQCSKKIFNPVSSKEARALIKTKAQPLSGYTAVENIYAAIAELLGYRGKNWADKVHYGQSAYVLRLKPNYEEMLKTQDFSELHNLIWLERIYENLDNPSQWDVPIELDALASQIQLVAVLTNDHTYMDGTNLIGEEFKDIWTVDYCSRLHVKKALTPKLYGSSRSPRQLWEANKLEYTQEMLNKITSELAIGKFANANKFKDFIIGNVKPKVKMKVKIWNEEFQIECNRFKWEETKLVNYLIYHSETGKIKKVSRQVHQVPDTNQFKRYFQTLLLHNLDSQIANHICEQMDWVIPNHDAFTVHPNDAYICRNLYREKLYDIYKHRKTILKDYFKSIGIDKEYPDKDTEEVPYFSPFCLK